MCSESHWESHGHALRHATRSPPLWRGAQAGHPGDAVGRGSWPSIPWHSLVILPVLPRSWSSIMSTPRVSRVITRRKPECLDARIYNDYFLPDYDCFQVFDSSPTLQLGFDRKPSGGPREPRGGAVNLGRRRVPRSEILNPINRVESPVAVTDCKSVHDTIQSEGPPYWVS